MNWAFLFFRKAKIMEKKKVLLAIGQENVVNIL